MNFEAVSALRKEVLVRRNTLSLREVKLLSEAIVARFLALFQQGGGALLSTALSRERRNEQDGMNTGHLLRPYRVGMYRALPSEVELEFLEESFKKQGWQFFFPKVEIERPDIHEMEFVEVQVSDLRSSAAWKQHSYGMNEPLSTLQPLEPKALDLIFVPGVVFGESGERIGMGKGYYDRYLEKCSRALRVGLAFDFQVFPQVPQRSWDQRVHWVVTERREFIVL